MSLPSPKYAGSGQQPGGHQSMIGVISFLNRALAVVGARMSTVGTSLKVARMASALSNLSDHQLAEIGVTRRYIMRHAEHLIASENDEL